MARPSRLSKNRHGTFQIRWIVPVSVRGPNGRPKEIRVSLRTRDIHRARILCLHFNLAVEKARMTKQYDDLPLHLSHMTLTVGNMKVQIENDQDRRLFQDLLRNDSGIRDTMLEAIRSGTPPKEALAALVMHTQASLGTPAPLNPVLLKDALGLYESTRNALSRNRRATAGEKRRTIELLTAHLLGTGHSEGSLYVHEIRRDQLLNFIISYAKRRGKSSAPENNGDEKGNDAESNADVQRNDDEGGLSARTVLKAIGHLSDFFLYAVAQNWAITNPIDEAFLKTTEGLRQDASTSKRNNSYELFTHAEVQKIFEPQKYLHELNAADDFWAPLIGLYTGARLGEIVQLETASIKFDQHHGVHLMEIREMANGRRAAKNRNSVRKVPLADDLIALGFLDYHAHVRDMGAALLFPHRVLNQTRKDDPSKHVSRSFGEHLDEVGIKSLTKVFHSFRHTVVTRLHVSGVPLGDAELVVGHAAQDSHARMSDASPGSGTSQTHKETYIGTAQYDTDGIPLFMRLKLHMDHALRYNLDVAGLRQAASIVQEHTVQKADKSFSSGWHRNNKITAQAMVDRVAKAQQMTVSQKSGDASA